MPEFGIKVAFPNKEVKDANNFNALFNSQVKTGQLLFEGKFHHIHTYTSGDNVNVTILNHGLGFKPVFGCWTVVGFRINGVEMSGSGANSDTILPFWPFVIPYVDNNNLGFNINCPYDSGMGYQSLPVDFEIYYQIFNVDIESTIAPVITDSDFTIQDTLSNKNYGIKISKQGIDVSRANPEDCSYISLAGVPFLYSMSNQPTNSNYRASYTPPATWYNTFNSYYFDHDLPYYPSFKIFEKNTFDISKIIPFQSSLGNGYGSSAGCTIGPGGSINIDQQYRYAIGDNYAERYYAAIFGNALSG